MRDYEKYINALRKCAKEHENDRTFTGHIIVADLCRDTANLLEELEKESSPKEELEQEPTPKDDLISNIKSRQAESEAIINEIKNMNLEKYHNEKVIVRGTNSGVFYGTLIAKEGQEVELQNCRRIWYWNGAASLSELAVNGTKKPEDCKFTVNVENIVITDAIEIIPCTSKAVKSIEGG